MESNDNKERWVSEVMKSTTGMRKAEPGTSVYENVMNTLAVTSTGKTVKFPVKQWAAAAILLLAINIGSVVYFTSKKSDQTKGNTGNPLAAEMQLGATYNY